MRSLFCISCLFFHSCWLLTGSLSPGTLAYSEYTGSVLFGALTFKIAQVDGFFMLSGFIFGLKVLPKADWLTMKDVGRNIFTRAMRYILLV